MKPGTLVTITSSVSLVTANSIFNLSQGYLWVGMV